MTILRFPKPAAMTGAQLAVEVGVDPLAVSVVGDTVEIVTDLDGQTVKAALDGHIPAPPPPDPAEEFRAAVDKATSIADLRAALLGTTGPGAEPRRPSR